MIADVSETSVVISTECNDGTDDIMISIPKREQTNEEVSRTQKFAEECIELLKHVPECRLPFNKFIPAYHHHFGRQCRYSCNKITKGCFFSESAIRFSNLPIFKIKIFQKTILSLKFEFVVYCYWQEI